MIVLTLYTRPGCHLCDDMKAVVARVTRNAGPSTLSSWAGPALPSVTLEEVDVSSSPDLERDYGLEIPVLLANGTKVAKYRITEMELRRVLTARARD